MSKRLPPPAQRPRHRQTETTQLAVPSLPCLRCVFTTRRQMVSRHCSALMSLGGSAGSTFISTVLFQSAATSRCSHMHTQKRRSNVKKKRKKTHCDFLMEYSIMRRGRLHCFHAAGSKGAKIVTQIKPNGEWQRGSGSAERRLGADRFGPEKGKDLTASTVHLCLWERESEIECDGSSAAERWEGTNDAWIFNILINTVKEQVLIKSRSQIVWLESDLCDSKATSVLLSLSN